MLKKLICLTIFLVPQVFAAQTHRVDHIVAIVNDQAILESDVDNMLNILVPLNERADPRLPSISVLKSQVLKKICDTFMQLQFAEKHGITVDSETVTERIKTIAEEQNMSLDSFYQMLRDDMHVSVDSYRNFTRDEIIVSRLQENFLRDLSISDAEVQGFLESPAGQDQSGIEYHIRHILLSLPNNSQKSMAKLQEEAKNIIVDLKNGADFGKIAMEKSSSPNALKGGDLGWRTAAQLPTLFLNNVLAMKVGEVYGPIKTESGLHIIKLEEKRSDQQTVEQEYHIQQILIKTGTLKSSRQAKELLTQIKAKLDNGADFAKLAKQYSDEKNTANKGGDLGWITKEQMTPKFFVHIEKLPLNAISEPFETEDGWHLAILLSQRSQVNSTEAARNNARNVIIRRKAQENIETLVQRIREQTKIEIIDKKYALS
jgi:peptidyl-prolyl cis-trans isomerase SurA